jgi:salicylate hydroxylase
MIPFLAQGAASAIEDGAVLANCLRKCISKDDVPRYIEEFETLRQERITELRRGALFNERILHLPDGEEQAKRDCDMREIGSASNPNLWSDPTFSQWLFGFCVTSLDQH